MKLNKFCILAVGMAVAMTSCSEGQYWDEVSNPVEVYAFPKTAETYVVPTTETAPTSWDVTVRRSIAGPAVTVPVTFETDYATVLSGADEVSFEAGQTEAIYTIEIASGISAGTTYSATITLDQPDDETKTLVMENAKNLVFTFNISMAINWVDAGTAACISDWVGNEDPIDVPVQYAENVKVSGDAKLMRLLSPFWYMEPDYADEGYNLQFYVDKDNNALQFPSWQWMGEVSSGYDFFIGCPASMGCSFTNDGDVFTLNGYIAYGEAKPQAYYAPEVFVFTWSDYSK